MKRTFKQLALCLALLSAPLLSLAANVNINTASAETLSTELKGIGDSKAQAIIRYRQTNGNFTSVEQLSAVPGIGEKTVAKLKPQLTIK